jgi:hypothetical protein
MKTVKKTRRNLIINNIFMLLFITIIFILISSEPNIKHLAGGTLVLVISLSISLVGLVYTYQNRAVLRRKLNK